MYGIIDSEYIESDYMYGNICGLSKEDLPAKYISKHFKVKNQDNSMKCVGFATSSLMEIREMMRVNAENIQELSPQFAYYMAKTLDGLSGKTTGTTLKAISDAMKKYGICTESLCNTNTKDGDLLSTMNKPSLQATEDAKQRQIDGYARITTLDEIKKAVYQEGGCLISMLYYRDMMTCNEGYMGKPSAQSSKLGNHCKLVIGYDDEHVATVKGRQYKGFMIQLNSYGDSQGRFGVEYVPYEMMTWCGGTYGYTVDKIFREAFVFYDNTNVINNKFHIDNQVDNIIKSAKPISMEFTIGSDVAIVDGKSITMDASPKIVNGTTFLPIRFIMENMGMEVTYVKELNGHDSITGVDMNTARKISMNIGYKIAYVNGNEYVLYMPPFIENGRTYLPLRGVAEMCGCDVKYDAATKKIRITR